MRSLRLYITGRPRSAAAIAFGGAALFVTHLAWVPDARMSHAALTIAAGLAHAIAGAFTGPRLLDTSRTRNPAQASWVGAATSVLAVLLFSPAYVGFLCATGVRAPSPLSYLTLAVLTGVFSFLAVGWALLLVSAGVAWGIYRIGTARHPC